MQLHTMAPAILMAMLVLGACDDNGVEPVPASEGVHLGFVSSAHGTHSASGSVASSGSILDSDFAVAVDDSLRGIVILSYDADSRGLFILQIGERATGTYSCADTQSGAALCHGRYLLNVRVESDRLVLDGRLELSTGTLVLNQLGQDMLRGRLQARLEPVAGTAMDTLIVSDGTLNVRYIPQQLEDSRLFCLLELVGADSGNCVQ